MAKLGTTQRPAVLRVQSMERADEVMGIAERNGWKVVVGVEPDKPENTADLETLMQGGAAPIRRALTVGRPVRQRSQVQEMLRAMMPCGVPNEPLEPTAGNASVV